MALTSSPLKFAALGAVLALGLTGCKDAQTAAPAAQEVPEISFLIMEPQSRPIVRELPGRTAPTRIAEVRARVSGIVIERAFLQGSEVKAGDVLYRIDPKPFEVELQLQEAAMAKAAAMLEQAHQQAKRIETLFQGKSASQAQLEQAVSANRQAEADFQARTADVQRARLNLEYATVRSPINGRVGGALVTEGALVGQNEATHLTTVQQLDPIYADFTQSITELSQLRRDLERGDIEQVAPETAKVRLVLDDGSIYIHPGKLLFSGAQVEPSTGKVTLRGEFPNPKQELLPGMYVRVQLEQGIDSDAIAVPSQAIQRNFSGNSEVYVIRDDNVVIAQPVRVGGIIEGQRLITEGLKKGDRVVVEGFQKITAGIKVTPIPWTQPATANPAQRADVAPVVIR
ncbi:Toluene efflux pump periplasmic linker protein TtgG precursor [Variibacter gotjawalensis]|uniref:Toluene efflux pump periplasmic linker protein TtgG n=1 Tax=Variibacter gotjawalensis TaxID=1333996 RepID=A0A0S3PT49_9BRAD|nr:membrane fusion protein (multidrug efflux system) [Variibacter gotjawalensis]RZS51304.1 membrane fusion protein (multidrug efflux system) [Variibacter gotjawalensis]BAT59137.1 Toluene efflux pump periplasmic linker protein TtgG precursor [Variibacter gotjawalensis]